MYKRFFPFLLFLLIATFSFSQNKKIEKQLDDLLSPYFKLNEPGCDVLVVKEGQVIYQKAFGSADLELNVPMKTGMVFKLASITKQFTAVAILQLVEQGKISLQDSLQKFVPDYPFKGNTITIENLLTHTSGIPDYMQLDYHSPNMERWDFRPKQLIDSFRSQPLQFIPGTKYTYSNSGYYLLGYIIEKVSGISYQNYILTPLGLTHSYFDNGSNIIPNRVNGYNKENKVFMNADFWSPSIAYAAGGLLSTTEDLYKWFKALLDHKVLKKETLDKAFAPYKLNNGSLANYGYGWTINHLSSIPSIGHSGRMNGFVTDEIYYPKQDVYITLLFNSESVPKDEIAQAIAEIVLGQSLQTGIKIDDKLMNSYVGVYRLTIDPKRTITVVKEGDHLVAKVSRQANYEILFQTPSKFQLKSVKEMAAEFITENGVVTKFIVTQNGEFEWRRE